MYKLPTSYSITTFNLERNLESDTRRFVFVHCFTYPNIKLLRRTISKEDENLSLTSDSIIKLRDAIQNLEIVLCARNYKEIERLPIERCCDLFNFWHLWCNLVIFDVKKVLRLRTFSFVTFFICIHGRKIEASFRSCHFARSNFWRKPYWPRSFRIEACAINTRRDHMPSAGVQMNKILCFFAQK